MKTFKWALIPALGLFLLLAVIGCGATEAPTALPPTEMVQAPTDTPVPATDTPLPPTDTPLPPPTDTALPEPTVESSSGGLDVGMLEQPSGLDSFRSNMTLSWTGTVTDGSEVSGSFVIAVEYIRDPLTQHASISGDFPGLEDLGLEEGSSLEMYQVGDTLYISLFGSWMQIPAEQAGLDASDMAFVATDEMLQGLQDATYEGETTFNGIQTKHYSFDQNSFQPGDLPQGMDIKEAKGNVYVAVEGNYLVHLDLTMSGQNVEIPTGQQEVPLQNGTLEIVADVTDVNQPFTIELPAEAQASGQPPEDIPVPDGAENLQVVDMMGMTSFMSAQTPAEVTAFYKAEMPNNGWTETSVDEGQDMASLEYSKGDRTASILITTDSESGQTSVLITVSGGE